jgi:V8-like Glu-specific endopeptidase
MASISGEERKKLREALAKGFPAWESLRRMALDQLDYDLNLRTSAGMGVKQNADELIDEMDEQMGRAGVVRLIESARAERPDNPYLREAEQLILHTSDLMDDVQPTEDVADKVATRVGLERVIIDAAGFPRFEDVMSRLGVAEYRVCLIDYQMTDGSRVCGTGFLVANDLVMTNNHVICKARKDGRPGSAIELAFGYRSKQTEATRYKLVEQNWLVVSDGVLDYALLRVQGSPGSDPLATKGTLERGYFKLVNETPKENEPLLILQHPYDKLEGSPSTLRLTIGFAHRREEGQLEHVLKHSANTDEGSSGSPVFSGRMDLIGLHNWGGPEHNEAIRMGSVRDHLQLTGHKALLG